MYMLDKLIHLLFSNLWIVIVLFWVLRGLAKSGTMSRQNRRPSRPHPVPGTTTTVSQTELVPVGENDRVQRKDQKASRREPEGVTMAIKEDIQKGLISSPVEGMMWGEVFGPPRSKQPYLRRKQ
jgi:hypothetical protein